MSGEANAGAGNAVMQDPAVVERNARALEAFQKAAKKVMRRMAESEKFRHVMMGTDTYGQILEAYALSLGKTLPELASMDPVAETWQRLHCQEG